MKYTLPNRLLDTIDTLHMTHALYIYLFDLSNITATRWVDYLPHDACAERNIR